MKRGIVIVLLGLSVIAAELSEFTTSTTSFTFDFYKQANVPSENVLISPISIHSALSMVYPLAGEKVSPAMQRHLYLPADKSQAASNLRGFLQALNNPNSPDTLKVLSKVYHVDEELDPRVEPLFKETFGADIEMADFNDQTKVAKSINSWVDQATNGMIKEFLKPEEVHRDSALMLLNAVALNATWKIPFSAHYTKSRPFHFVNGVHGVDMMFQDKKFLYAELPEYGCRAVELLYKDRTDLSMLIVLPDEESILETVTRKMNTVFYETINERLSDERIELFMPKFTIRKKTDAKILLKKMGLTTLFDEADLDLFVRDKSKITNVSHSTFINVNERGTEGAAASGLQAFLLSAPPEFRMDRPFLFMIRKRSTKDIIFIGHYSVYEAPQ